MPTFHEHGRLREDANGDIKGSIKIETNRSNFQTLRNVCVRRITDPFDWEIEEGYTHRIFSTEFSKEEDAEWREQNRNAEDPSG